MNTLQLFEKNKEYDIMETGQLVKEQSWVPGMGVALAAICQPRYGLEFPCSWGWPLSPSLLESGISLHGIHVGLFWVLK